jgi:hypothetical protein
MRYNYCPAVGLSPTALALLPNDQPISDACGGCPYRKLSPTGGIVTFASFTCQPRGVLEDRMEENQRFRGNAIVADSLENRLFLASVTMPREASLHNANQALAKVQAFLELGDAADIGDDERNVVEAYNRDDCTSTWRLRDWLETVRTLAIADSEIISRPARSDAEPSEALSEWQLKIAALVVSSSRHHDRGASRC